MSSPPLLVLASASPRRRELLALLGLAHVVDPADVDERPEPDEAPTAFALRAARDKALAVARRRPGDLVLGADTVVAAGAAILGKPRDDEEAAAMLRRLSGREHQVHTAVALARGRRSAALLDTARVRFAALTEHAVDWYVASGEPRDKAGAYAIQGRGGLFVTGVEGSPHTVVGLPLHRLAELFAELEIELWDLIGPPRVGGARASRRT